MITFLNWIAHKKMKLTTWLDILLMLLVITGYMFYSVAFAAEKKWFLSTVQYQISPDCSHDVHLYSKQAAQELSKHSVVFTEGLDAVYVSCEPTSPFINELRYLEPGTDSEDEELTLGTTRTTWYTSSMQIFRAHIWIDPNLAHVFGNLRGVLLHEFSHAIGEGHTDGGIMAPSAKGDYLDAHTIARIRARYLKPPASVVDRMGNFYIPCMWVHGLVALIVQMEEGYYWVKTENGEIAAFGKSGCNQE